MNAKALRWFPLLVFFSLIAFSPAFLWAGEVDILIKKLVEKGILTKQDANGIVEEIRQETAQQEKKTQEEKQAQAETKKVASTDADAAGWPKEIPEWVKNTKFGGDLRLRYQYQDREGDPTKETRERFRIRAGAETKVMDQVKVGFGLIADGDDPRSGTDTFQDTFSKKSVRIDYAFAEYTPASWLNLIGGKFYNPLYRPDDLVWDGDITPEGAAAKFRRQVLPNLELYLNAAFYILDEKTNDKDPYMTAFQPGLIWNITSDVNLQFALAYYYFGGVKGSTLDFSSGTNSTVGGKLVYDYDAPVLSAELGFKNPFGLVFIPYFGLFGEYVYNPDPDTDNSGYLAGLRVGHPDMKKFGDWRWEISYRHLEKDAWPDVFPDSDFYSGSTNVEGMETILNFAFWRNIWLTLDYYHARKILGLEQKENLFQADLNLKF